MCVAGTTGSVLIREVSLTNGEVLLYMYMTYIKADRCGYDLSRLWVILCAHINQHNSDTGTDYFTHRIRILCPCHYSGQNAMLYMYMYMYCIQHVAGNTGWKYWRDLN